MCSRRRHCATNSERLEAVNEQLEFDIYGRFTLRLVRAGGGWRAFRRGEGLSRPERGLLIPDSLPVEELATFLDDFYHELALPGQEVRRLNP